GQLIVGISRLLDWLTLQRGESVSAACDFQPSLGPHELDARSFDSGSQSGLKSRCPLRRIFQQDMDRVRGSTAVFVMIDATRRHSRLWQIFIHEPLDDIDPMGEQICNLAATEIQVGPPIPELLNVPIAPGTGAEEFLPVQSGRLFREGS